MCTRPRWITALVAIVLSVGPILTAECQAAAKVEKADSWQVIFLSGQRIGYAHSSTEPFEHGGKEMVRSTTIANMTIKRFGQSLVMRTTLITEETIDGDLLKFSYESANPPASSTSTMGTIDGDLLKIKQTVNGKVKETSQAWRKEVKSPAYQDRLLREAPLKAGETRSFEAFMPEFNRVATIKLNATDLEETTLLEGKTRKLLKIKMTQSVLPGIVMNAFVDEKGEAIKTGTSMLGTEMAFYLVDRDEALKAISGAELDLAVSTLVKVKRIPNPHSTKTMKYRVTTKGKDAESLLPSGETQKVTRNSDEISEVVVTALPIPEKGTIEPVAAEFLASTQYLQADDQRVTEHASKAAGDEKDPARIARLMEKYVHEKLEKKNFSTAMASAGEVARTLEGDCTEHAVLLAGMLRARGIPSRVVVGLVYVDSLSAFGGHMWTEANLGGHWIPLDATLGRGGIGAAHLKLSDSSLNDDGPSALSSFAPLMLVIGQLQIEVIE